MSGTSSHNAEGAVYVIQTLVDDKWVTFKKYAESAKARQSMGSLLDLWGRQRVRVLIGNFDVSKQRRIYSNITDKIYPPRDKVEISTPMAIGRSKIFGFFHAHKIKITVSAIAAIFSAIVAISYPSFAGNMPVAAVATIEYPFDIREKFVSVIGLSYGKLLESETIPPRMQGKWSTDCSGNITGYQLGENVLLQQGATPLTLNGVLQKGQDYGLMLEDGTIVLMEMQGVDQLQLGGYLSRLGEHREADAAASVLKRCL